MIRVVAITALLLVATSVRAQEDPDCPGCVVGHLIGDPSPAAAPTLRPQLVAHHDHATPIGVTAAVIGGVSVVASFSLYVARQNYRLRAWSSLSTDTIDQWSKLGAWSFWLGVSGSALLVTSEYLLLPESRDTPMLAWFAGAGGLALAAVGVAFAAGGTHCGPERIAPGAELNLACTAGTSDGIFGPLLIATAMPMLNWPLTYLFRRAFAGAPESLSVGPRGAQLRVRF